MNHTSVDHPDDLRHRREIIETIRAERIRRNISVRSINRSRYARPTSRSRFETLTNPHVSTVQWYAAAVGLTTTLDPGVGNPNDPAVAMWSGCADPDRAERMVCAARLVAAQDTAGITCAELAQRLGVSPPAVAGLRAARKDPLLSTWQRWARALGGILTIGLEPQ